MGNSQSPSANPRFTAAARAFTQRELEDLKSVFTSLAEKSRTDNQYISPSVFKAYIGIDGPLGDRMLDIVTQKRHDQKLTFEDLVIAKGVYEKGSNDEIEEFIYQLVDVTGDGILTRSDMEAVLTAMLDHIFSHKGSEPGEGSHQEIVGSFLSAAEPLKDSEGCFENGMSFDDFRKWCILLPSVRKFLGSLLMPSESVTLIPHLLHQETINTNLILLKDEYAWHIGGALPHQQLDEWKLLYHSTIHGLSFNTFLGNVLNEGPSVLVIKDTEGCIYGGYASQPWERHADFYGNMKSFLFQLYPRTSIFRPTGANHNIQWCAMNFSSDSIPNGLGFGGKVNHFGLFLSANFDQGHTFSSTTFGNPSLSKSNKIYPEIIECWGIVQKGEQEGSQAGVKGTILERFKEDHNMLKMVGIANSSE